ncbi:hypothetical protein HG530_001949 [Fusarium avenaceum]|nr:hypothetical protein HG530_001949 [Fusarium avenaceum]
MRRSAASALIPSQFAHFAYLTNNLHIVAKVNGISVSHAHERLGRLLEVWVVLLDGLGGEGVLEGQIDNTANDVLKMVKEVVKGDKVQLGLDVGVLRKLPHSTYMSAGERLLGTERLLNAVAVTKDGQNSLESGTTLDLGLHKSRRADLLDLQLLVNCVESILDDIANEHDGGGLLVTQSKVAEVHEGVGITIDGNAVGEGIITTGGLGNDSEVIRTKLAVERGVGTGGNLPQLTNDLERCLS